jgi:hypothetical protein
MKCLIINFNRLTLPVKLANWAFNHGLEPIFIDNNSDYPPLLGYYGTRCPYKVLKMDRNYGYRVIWLQNVLKVLEISGKFIVTDPDLDLSMIPDDFLSVLEEGLRRYPEVTKCGFSLELEGVKHKDTLAWEAPFWKNPLDDQYFDAILDTTFALYHKKEFSYSAIRTNRPYTCKHVPWYYEDLKDLPEDEQYYYKTMDEETKKHQNLKA